MKNRLNEGPQKDKLLTLLISRLEDRDRVNYKPRDIHLMTYKEYLDSTEDANATGNDIVKGSLKSLTDKIIEIKSIKLTKHQMDLNSLQLLLNLLTSVEYITNDLIKEIDEPVPTTITPIEEGTKMYGTLTSDDITTSGPLAVSSRINFTCEYVDGDYINVSVL